MSLFRLQWLRLLVRRHSKPIAIDRAALWKQRLSVVYALTAWNAFGFVMYMIFSGKADWAKAHGLKTEADIKLTPAQQWSKSLGIKNATVYRVSGFKVSKYEIHNESDETKQLQEEGSTLNDKAQETK